MTYHFTILSPENEEFVRRIAIDHEASFLVLHEAIIASVGFEPKEMCSFFTSNNDWEKMEEVTILDMEETDCMIMEDTLICDLVSKRKDRLIYTFDMLNDRCFFLELSKITTETMAKEYLCTLSEGRAPHQKDDELLTKNLLSKESLLGDEALRTRKSKSAFEGLPELDDLEKFENIDDIENIDELFADGEDFMEDEFY